MQVERHIEHCDYNDSDLKASHSNSQVLHHVSDFSPSAKSSEPGGFAAVSASDLEVVLSTRETADVCLSQSKLVVGRARFISGS